MSDHKKSWETPQLVILARGKPEETLQNDCKAIGTPVSGPAGTTQDGCNKDATGDCGSCQGRAGGIS